MREMFAGASRFNRDVFENVEAVMDMNAMFQGAIDFNNDNNIRNWDVRAVSDMRSMFEGASSFQGDLSNWQTKNVERMQSMFRDARRFSSRLCWDRASLDEGDDEAEIFEGSNSSFLPYPDCSSPGT